MQPNSDLNGLATEVPGIEAVSNSNEGMVRDSKAVVWATGSLVLGIASFFSLLGMEKAVLAIVMGVIALRVSTTARRRTWAKVGIGLGFAMIAAVVIGVLGWHEQITAFVDYVRQF